jgi:hypothetical protein
VVELAGSFRATFFDYGQEFALKLKLSVGE